MSEDRCLLQLSGERLFVVVRSRQYGTGEWHTKEEFEVTDQLPSLLATALKGADAGRTSRDAGGNSPAPRAPRPAPDEDEEEKNGHADLRLPMSQVLPDL